MNSRINDARLLAHEAHNAIGQRRKYTLEPYWFHTDEVADIVLEYGGTEDQIIAAHLHDYREDVVKKLIEEKRFSDLAVFENRYIQFGPQVGLYVVELTDVFIRENFPHWNRAKRKQMERERIAQTSPESKTIKLADLCSNTKSIIKHDKDFAVTYIKEKIELLPVLKEGNSKLWKLANIQVDIAVALLGL